MTDPKDSELDERMPHHRPPREEFGDDVTDGSWTGQSSAADAAELAGPRPGTNARSDSDAIDGSGDSSVEDEPEVADETIGMRDPGSSR